MNSIGWFTEQRRDRVSLLAEWGKKSVRLVRIAAREFSRVSLVSLAEGIE